MIAVQQEDIDADMEVDIKRVDRGELTSLMDPLLIGDGSRHHAALGSPNQLAATAHPAYQQLTID